MVLKQTNDHPTALPHHAKPSSDTVKGEDADSNIAMLITQENDIAVVTIHPLEGRDAVIMKVDPPLKPLDATIEHVPCDIVLVIDVSSSMESRAPAPVQNEQGDTIKEDLGLSILDLVKHAARTIVSTLNENDRLGIVTFGLNADVVQALTPMTETHKAEVDDRISQLRAYGRTNLWGGIREGLELFELPGEIEDAACRVPALMVLTDGQPNISCPPEGYVRRLRAIMQSTQAPLPAIINTFGFGYQIDSGLLKSIAEASNGNFAFIPDAGMIGTVFIHAVAHLQSTYATRCTLEISAPEGALLRSTIGKSIDQPRDEGKGSRTLTIQLGNLQYGQSRDIYLENVDESGQRTPFDLGKENTLIKSTLTYSRMHYPNYKTLAQHDLREISSLPKATIAYHESRSRICKLLSSFSELRKDFTYNFPCSVSSRNLDIATFQRRLRELMDSIPAKDYDDELNESLMEDLTGQISDGLSNPESFHRWGGHYFHSLRNAHASQSCNSFKDPGPLMYNKDPFFIRCRDRLSDAFDGLPPPPPSLPPLLGFPISHTPAFTPTYAPTYAEAPRIVHRSCRRSDSFSMALYNSNSNPCFAAESPVLLASGVRLPIGDLRAGMIVQTPVGGRRVRAILLTVVQPTRLCRVGGILATPWHPINPANEDEHPKEWVFPEHVAETKTTYSGEICSVLLEPHRNPDAHAIRIGDVWGVTLGHGILSGDDIRAHRFLGDYDAVLRELATLDLREENVHFCTGVRKDPVTGMVCGFQRLPGFPL